jgi:glucoamylase
MAIMSFRFFHGHRQSGRMRSYSTRGIIAAAVLVTPLYCFASSAPGAPGGQSVWASAKKDFLGTSATADSRVYFTGAQGILTEVFYPTLDMAQNVDLQFLVTDSVKTWGDEEKQQKSHAVALIDKRAPAWQSITTADNGKWRITKRIFSDPHHQTVIMRTTFATLEPGKTVGAYNVYLLNNPAVNNSGGGRNCSGGQDYSRTSTGANGTMLVAWEPNASASALAVSLPWKTTGGKPMVSNGFVGVNDGFTDLFGGSRDLSMNWTYDSARGGNVAQMGLIAFPASATSSVSFDVVLGFGTNETGATAEAAATLQSTTAALETDYINGWKSYTGTLNNQNGQADDQYYLSAITLKCSQDKSNGAMVAGMGSPWGETVTDQAPGGYHLVWARDLFKFASALLAAGDSAAGNRAVDYLFKIQMGQQGSPTPGRFPQNSWVSGVPYWNGTQMDETAMPIILAWKLHRADLWSKVKLAAEYLSHNGPSTGQDRWEEMAGYSPSTIAAEIAGLVCAAELARQANDTGAAKYYLQIADGWRNNIAGWLFTTTGFHKGNGKYYVRINVNQDPNDDVQLAFGNGGGTHGERFIIDGGFLELVRMGALSPADWTIRETMPEYDSILKQTIPGKGAAWFRYNYDGYGESNTGAPYNGTGRGRLWPIFTAERGIYEIARSGQGSVGQTYLQMLKAFSSPAGFIPEQVWNVSASVTGWQTTTPPQDTPGTATNSMRPLNWAMGEYINLFGAIRTNRSDAPAAVVKRYSTDKPQVTVSVAVNASTVWGENIYLVGDHPLMSEWKPESGIKLSPVNYPVWSVKLSLPASTAFQYKFVKRNDNGAVTWESGQNRVLTTPATGTAAVNESFRN